jgi:hypothetical protein
MPFDHQVEVLLVDLLDLGNYLPIDELLDGLAHLALFIGEVLGRKHVGAGTFDDQVLAAFQDFFSHYRHLKGSVVVVFYNLSKMPAAPMPPPIHMETMP